VWIGNTRRAAHDQAQVVINRSQQTVARAQHQEVVFTQRTLFAQTFQRERRGTILPAIDDLVAQLQVTRRKINVEHSARTILDINSCPPPASSFLFLQTVPDSSSLQLQLVHIKVQRVLVNAMPRVRLDHLAELEIAADRTQLHVREPLPRRALLFQIIEKTL